MSTWWQLGGQWCTFIVLLCGAGLSVTPFRALIEQSMFVQMVVQMPLLFVGGFLLTRLRWVQCVLQGGASWNVYGLTGLMLAQTILVYWMLPISIDRAIVIPWVDGLKIVSMIIAGVFVGDALRRSPATLQLFFMGYFAAMTIWLGIYFIVTQTRLCNAYSLNSQRWTGYGLLLISLLVVGAWSYKAYKTKTFI